MTAWNTVSRIHIERAIQSQIPDFKDRRLLNEADDLEQAAIDMANEDFGWSLCFTPGFIARLFYAGFLTISTNLASEENPLFVALPKMHLKRCIVNFDEFHVPRKIRKIARQFYFSVNTDFQGVLSACQIQHGRDSWLCPPLVAALTALHFSGTSPRVVSVELRSSTGNLVAGELGVIVGAAYTALTGFCDRQASSGKVQISALAAFLRLQNILLFDLGMVMPYKIEIGGHEIQRKEFLNRFRLARNEKCNFQASNLPAKELIDNLISWQTQK